MLGSFPFNWMVNTSTEVESKRSQVFHCFLGFSIYLAHKSLIGEVQQKPKIQKGANWIKVNQFGGPQIW